MAKYRVKEKSYIGTRICEAGDVVDYDGKPGSNLEPVEEEPPKAVKGGKVSKLLKDEPPEDSTLA